MPPRIPNYTLAVWADRIHVPVAQISPAIAPALVAGTVKSFEALSRSAETAGGFTPMALPGVRLDLHAAVDRHIVPEANAAIGLELKKGYDNNGSQLVRRSDQWPFLQSGVPALGFRMTITP